MAAEHALFHSEFPHLLQDHCRRADIRPQHNSIDTRVFNHLELVPEVSIPGIELLFDHHRMPKATGGVAEFEHSKTPVAVVNPQDGGALQPQFCVDMSRERISLRRDRLEDR